MDPEIGAEIDAETEFEELVEKKPWPQVVAKLARRQPLGAFGFCIVVIMLLLSVCAEFVTVYDPELNAFEVMLTPPGDQFFLDTDQFGRDVLTRIIFGARTALLVGFSAAFLGASAGLVLGVASAYFGDTFDLLFQRVMDVFLAFPLIIMALAIVSIFGPGLENVIIAITIPFIPQCARVVRSNALAIAV